MAFLDKLGKLGMVASGNPLGLAKEGSALDRVAKVGQGVARIMGGDVAGGAATIGAGLAKGDSPLARLAATYDAGRSVAGGISSIMGPSGQRGAMGEANLGVNTDLGYGPAPGQIEMPELGSSMRRRAMRGPSLMGRG